ncbi:MAG: MBL fold metallo-hydrolase, partial [Balneolaceae bacterium]|nr:MBL fold metallo-hydrolase [Balneolaceae bacterium]
MYFKQIFDEKLAQYAYLIGCQATGEAIIIDPMRDIDQYVRLAQNQSLKIVAATETHIHADFLSGLREFAEHGVKVYASDEGDEDWKYEWLKGSGYDYGFLYDGDEFPIGNIRFKVKHTPGHTPEHISFLVTDGAAADEPMGMLSGDFIFVGDVGRPDLLESAAGQVGSMERSAKTLYRSVEEFKSMPEYLQVWPGHGAGSACGKALGAVPESSVGYELRFNNSIKAADSEQHFVDYILEGQPEPPLYFARMKRDNRKGPKILEKLPQPERMSIDAIQKAASNEGNVILDTRERLAFMGGHLAGSLLAP